MSILQIVVLALIQGITEFLPISSSGHLLLVRAYERANASTLAPFTYAHTVAALFTGWLVFGTFPDAPALAGMTLIVATGVAMAVARRF